eukprot:GILK01013019.1.p1 GENE.GILK01013019.1~~GILK01013019.1.p1  ORF type:complete len:163 (+),score=15.84 GILK01013019.1:181-669(+)
MVAVHSDQLDVIRDSLFQANEECETLHFFAITNAIADLLDTNAEQRPEADVLQDLVLAPQWGLSPYAEAVSRVYNQLGAGRRANYRILACVHPEPNQRDINDVENPWYYRVEHLRLISPIGGTWAIGVWHAPNRWHNAAWREFKQETASISSPPLTRTRLLP